MQGTPTYTMSRLPLSIGEIARINNTHHPMHMKLCRVIELQEDLGEVVYQTEVILNQKAYFYWLRRESLVMTGMHDSAMINQDVPRSREALVPQEGESVKVITPDRHLRIGQVGKVTVVQANMDMDDFSPHNLPFRVEFSSLDSSYANAQWFGRHQLALIPGQRNHYGDR